MKPYQEEYLELLRSAAMSAGPSAGDLEPEEFVTAVRENVLASRQAVERGTKLLREELFPVLDNILSASREEIDGLFEFAGQLMRGEEHADVGLHYRIHLALMDYARHMGLRDMLIRELYLVAMSLYNLENMLPPNPIRLFRTRMRLYFTEAASHFDTDYDEIEDPETRGYIHRSMGNIALGYGDFDQESSEGKLRAVTRSIAVLSDPEVRAKTPSLPWDLYLSKSHQECTSLLAYLRTGNAGPEAFAQVMESAQVVQESQIRAARDRGQPLQPRWQYAFMAAKYHTGGMGLPELMDGLYALTTTMPDDDYGAQSIFSHLTSPAMYMEYSKQLRDPKLLPRAAQRCERMTRRMLSWIFTVPNSDGEDQFMFGIRQFLYAYREFPGGTPFYEVLQNVFAARHPRGYVRMWVAGRVARRLTDWAVDDCPEKLVGLPGCDTAGDVIWRRQELRDFAARAGRLYDTGMVHFFKLESSVCRGLFEEEEALLQLHANCGWKLLSEHPSTAVYADIAHGHHRWFDEKGGYPVDFAPGKSPARPMIYLIAVADALAATTPETASRSRPVITFDEAIDQLTREQGTHYAPFAVALLKDPARRESLRQDLTRWQKEAYLHLYRRRAKAGE